MPVDFPPPFNPLESFYSLGLAQNIPSISRVIGSSLSTALLRCGGIFALSRPIISEALDRMGSGVELQITDFDAFFGREISAIRGR